MYNRKMVHSATRLSLLVVLITLSCLLLMLDILFANVPARETINIWVKLIFWKPTSVIIETIVLNTTGVSCPELVFLLKILSTNWWSWYGSSIGSHFCQQFYVLLWNDLVKRLFHFFQAHVLQPTEHVIFYFWITCLENTMIERNFHVLPWQFSFESNYK